MNYQEDNYTWFDHPDFEKNQQELIGRTKALKGLGVKKDAFSLDSVFDANKAMPEAKLGALPNLTGNDQFKNFGIENPVPKDSGLLKTGAKSQKDFMGGALGAKGQDVAGSSIDFAKDAFQAFSTTSESEGESAANAFNLTAKGAKAGMAIGGPWGAAIGAGAGLLVGGYDYFHDFGSRNQNARNKNEKKFQGDHAKLEQETRQKDGLDSLTRLSALRKQQENYIV